MIGSIQRLWHLVPKRPLVPAMMLMIGVNVSPDPNRRSTGYGGVLPVPATPAPAAAGHPDPLLEQQRRDMRAARGRVLYAPGRAPDAAPAKTAHKVTCPDQRIVQGRAARTSPTS
jgi:hypothetical protein